jgi:hypothetical protein
MRKSVIFGSKCFTKCNSHWTSLGHAKIANLQATCGWWDVLPCINIRLICEIHITVRIFLFSSVLLERFDYYHHHYCYYYYYYTTVATTTTLLLLYFLSLYYYCCCYYHSTTTITTYYYYLLLLLALQYVVNLWPLPQVPSVGPDPTAFVSSSKHSLALDILPLNPATL